MRFVSTMHGVKDIVIKNQYVTAATVINKGACVSKQAGTQSIALTSTGTQTLTAVYGLADKKSTATDTFTTMPIIVLGQGALVMAEIEECVLGTPLTATGGSATTTVDSTLVGAGSDDVLIGAELEVVTNAAGVAVGTTRVLTDYTVSTGTCTYATTTLATAAADTFKINYVGYDEDARYLIGEDLLDVNGEADMIELNIAAGGDWCRVVDVRDDGKALLLSVSITYATPFVLPTS